MNRALLYLWFALLKRRAFDFVRSLRRPTTLIGFVYVLGLLGVLFWFRHHEIFGRLVQRDSLITGAFLMLGGSLIKGFWQRGLVFEPPDIEFLFTSPFTQRQIVCYRLLPNYLYALVQGTRSRRALCAAPVASAADGGRLDPVPNHLLPRGHGRLALRRDLPRGSPPPPPLHDARRRVPLHRALFPRCLGSQVRARLRRIAGGSTPVLPGGDAARGRQFAHPSPMGFAPDASGLLLAAAALATGPLSGRDHPRRRCQPVVALSAQGQPF